jgi:hypothetical protein
MAQIAPTINQYTVTASSASLNASTDQLQYGTTLKAKSTNTGTTYVQINGTTVTTANGWPLEPGASIFIPRGQSPTLASILVIGTAADILAYSAL